MEPYVGFLHTSLSNKPNFYVVSVVSLAKISTFENIQFAITFLFTSTLQSEILHLYTSTCICTHSFLLCAFTKFESAFHTTHTQFISSPTQLQHKSEKPSSRTLACTVKSSHSTSQQVIFKLQSSHNFSSFIFYGKTKA